jgi:hypothetical protein
LNASNLSSGTVPAAQMPALTGDVTNTAGSLAMTLATVNSNIGTFQGLTINGKGLVTAATNQNYLTGNQTITVSGDASGSGTTSIPLTLATVNSNVGSFGSSTAIPSFTVNGKGLITAVSTNAVVAPAGTLTGSALASGVTSSSLTSFGTLTAPVNIGTPAITDSGILLQATSSVAGYNQFLIQNTSNDPAASTNFVVNNNLGTSSTYYGEFGMNSSAFTGASAFSLANAVYLDSVSGDLSLGTMTSNSIHFVTNNSAADSLTIGTNSITIPAFSTAGVVTNNASGVLASSSNVSISSATLSPAVNTSGLTITGGTDTASNKLLNITSTWNNASTVFDAPIFMNVNLTAANFASKFLDIQKNSGSIFSIDQYGVVYANSGYSSNNDTFMLRQAAATWQFGYNDAAAPVAQTFKVQNVVAGTTDTAGAAWNINGSISTGTAAPGAINFKTGFAAATSASTQNATATILSLGPSQVTGSGTNASVSITPTWNTTGVVDAGLLINVTNTASGAGSKLFDAQVGGTSEFYVDKTGSVKQLGTETITSSSATSLTVGPSGATNPTLTVNSSTASGVAGLSVTNAATGGTVAVATTDSGSNNNLTIDAKGTGTIGLGTVSTGVITLGAASTVKSASATAFTAGANGATNPVLTVNANTASVATGISITGAATGGTTALATTDSGANSSLSINAKGTGTIAIGNVSTGAVTITPATTITGATTTASVNVTGATVPANGMYSSAANTLNFSTNTAIKAQIDATGIPLFKGNSSVTSAFTATSNITLASITGLSATLVAGKTYKYDIDAYYTAPTAGGVQFDLNGGTATATTLNGSGDQFGAVTSSTAQTALTTVVCSSATATSGHCHMMGTIVVNAAGTFIPRFAQNTSNASASSVLVGSSMVITQLQ